MFSPSGPVELVFFGGFEGCRALCYCDFYGGGWWWLDFSVDFSIVCFCFVLGYSFPNMFTCISITVQGTNIVSPPCSGSLCVHLRCNSSIIMYVCAPGKYAQVTNHPENDGCINSVLLVWSCGLYPMERDNQQLAEEVVEHQPDFDLLATFTGRMRRRRRQCAGVYSKTLHWNIADRHWPTGGCFMYWAYWW